MGRYTIEFNQKCIDILEHVRDYSIGINNRYLCISIAEKYVERDNSEAVEHLIFWIGEMLYPYKSLEDWVVAKYKISLESDVLALTVRKQWINWMIEEIKKDMV